MAGKTDVLTIPTSALDAGTGINAETWDLLEHAQDMREQGNQAGEEGGALPAISLEGGRGGTGVDETGVALIRKLGGRIPAIGSGVSIEACASRVNGQWWSALSASG